MKIGIVGSLSGMNVGVRYSYLNFIRNFMGGDPVILLPDTPIQDDLSLLILPGGADVSSLRYGEIPEYSYNDPDLILEYFDTIILPQYIKRQTPILGICRGLQTLNVAFGGTLYQEIDFDHEINPKDDPFKPVHNIYSYDTKAKMFKVNSRHHQGIKDLGKSLRPLLMHNSGLIEAFKHHTLPILAVQWHPEDLYDKEAMRWLREKLSTLIKE